jgi:hypothetical protein
VSPVNASVTENREEALQPLTEAVDHGSCFPSDIGSMRFITPESRCQYAACSAPPLHACKQSDTFSVSLKY